jgi:hypothetical protein
MKRSIDDSTVEKILSEVKEPLVRRQVVELAERLHVAYHPLKALLQARNLWARFPRPSSRPVLAFDDSRLLRKELKEREEEVSRLRGLIARTEVHFERLGSNVVIRNLAPVPLVVDHRKLFHFLREDGGKQLREFISREFFSDAKPRLVPDSDAA